MCNAGPLRRFGRAPVGITPPKVDGAEKPTSSVIISRILGAPFGGTMRAGQYGFDSAAFVWILPPNGCGGFGRYLPSIVVVGLGEPGVPVISCAIALLPPAVKAKSDRELLPVIPPHQLPH